MDCVNNSEMKDFIYVLKKYELLSFNRDIIANGKININIFIIMYRNEYERTRLRIPIDEKLFKNPWIEKTLKLLEESERYIFILLSKLEKQIEVPNNSSPIERITEDMLEFKSNMNPQMS